MGKCIERVRARQAIACKNRWAEKKLEAYERYWQEMRKDMEAVYVKCQPDPESEKPWWRFW